MTSSATVETLQPGDHTRLLFSDPPERLDIASASMVKPCAGGDDTARLRVSIVHGEP